VTAADRDRPAGAVQGAAEGVVQGATEGAAAGAVQGAVQDRVRALAVPLGLMLLAAALRLPDLATRGTWDGDQGHDMLMLRALVRDGIVPLLGPPTSIGDVHHGALYYYLLAPAAALTGGDSPLAVVFLIALAGIAAVGVTWWLGRSIAGPVAGVVAGLAMAISPAAIDESTFIWNPNLIALSSAIALAGAWHAWSTGRARWWLVAAAGTAVTMQSHVLGVTLLPIVGALLVADARRRHGRDRREVVKVGLAGLGLIAFTFLPLVIHELTTDFAEVNAALAYLRAGGEPPAQGPLGRLAFIGARVVSWPLVGLIVDGFAAAGLALVAVIAIGVWRAVAGRGEERTAVRWLGLGLVWTAFALTFVSPSLAVVVRGLPNDHYHAFADPMVFVLLGVGAAAVWRAVPSGGGRAASGVGVAGPGGGAARIAEAGRPPVGVDTGRVTPGRVLAVAGMLAIAAWAATHLPPPVHPDGGFPAAARAAERIEAAVGPGPIALRSLPTFKSVEAYAYPLVRNGWRLAMGAETGEATLTRGEATGSGPATLVVICDVLFEPVIGAACGGPAEAAFVPADLGEPIDRFDAAPGRVISIYRAGLP
jgi:4-amino-4-deoxy-L-arabinose transferase-like glycosyltransferase